ncbi:spore coat protein [Robertmurraya sp. DFI.2.37]|jgi:similar to spore coat protein|uniref:spore coat protein n=1 Tax=Robertmurraya sp. DFI.2.37 TaxID=3031819 RepID=UPI001246DFED|nr:spore coat protein [Robertmurraya sp. DFI.2.37]MDF1509082.1 spore coat protein [Robertmurraya sp. DFI.2.37]
MNNFMKTVMGMGAMTDKVIATDFLISTKAGIRNLAFAITETTTPELRAGLREELRNAVKTHEQITNFMIERGIYHPDDLSEQLEVDLQITETALKLSESAQQ